MTHDEILTYYMVPGPFTSLGAFAEQVDALPDDVGALGHAVQMLLVHRFWAQAYKVDVTPEREKEQGYHGAEAMLTHAMCLGPQPIGAVRLPAMRVAGVCRHFATMMCAFLRRKGVPSRARCGFATYCEPGKYGDHWICEYWDAAGARWVQVDAQLDALQRSVLKPDFDPLDVPRDRFLVAGAVWQGIRAGAIDPARCGIADMWGDWFVRGDLAIDIAALQKVELLPWEPFGIAKAAQSTIPDTPELLAFAIVSPTSRRMATRMRSASCSRWRGMTRACARPRLRSRQVCVPTPPGRRSATRSSSRRAAASAGALR